VFSHSVKAVLLYNPLFLESSVGIKALFTRPAAIQTVMAAEFRYNSGSSYTKETLHSLVSNRFPEIVLDRTSSTLKTYVWLKKVLSVWRRASFCDFVARKQIREYRPYEPASAVTDTDDLDVCVLLARLSDWYTRTEFVTICRYFTHLEYIFDDIDRAENLYEVTSTTSSTSTLSGDELLEQLE